ncbi:uncharacterized protein LOC114745432 [Neltuma alba]|uniref:uncharacterized protein LOC114745432 n=1 Tax=Neltuma alba TaxID=207710 RepID=UPI0010A30B79|nr:uncharacterized protein LOC114745432 [Prosopis alba]
MRTCLKAVAESANLTQVSDNVECQDIYTSESMHMVIPSDEAVGVHQVTDFQSTPTVFDSGQPQVIDYRNIEFNFEPSESEVDGHHASELDVEEVYNTSNEIGPDFTVNVNAIIDSSDAVGMEVDHSKNNGAGPYSFVMSGVNYHSIGSLLPSEGSRPVYSQLYIYDTENEVSNRIAAVSKHSKESTINHEIVLQIKNELDHVNPFVQQYRRASSMLSQPNSTPLKLCLLSSRQCDGRTYNLPTASEVAALIVGDIDMSFTFRDIIVHEHSGTPQRINELHASYLALQYPILFPFGEDGYRDDIEHREDTLSSTKVRTRLSMHEFFAYRLMSRHNEVSALLHASRLLQQFIVDGYTMIESQRLLWVRTHQKELRVDLYQGLTDAVLNGERNAASIGKRIILPSSFTGGARYMIKNYQDAMAICRSIGYPDIFLTFTCNPAWPEIQRFCSKNSLKPSDRPDILCRVFKMKLQTLMKILREQKIFGEVRAEIYTIEFQKRGLPHAHILLFLSPEDKMKDVNAIDRVICAEIPDYDSDPILHELVKKYMLHGPCGTSNPKSPCMKDKKCSKYFPKKFIGHTMVDDEGYPTYRRRDNGRAIEVKGVRLDNSKGNDRVVAAIFDNEGDNNESVRDEIRQYYNCRYISACEASWRIFGFSIHHRNPSVERLSFHLPNQQTVIYSNEDNVTELLDKPRVSESQFISWMLMNKSDVFARTLTYIEFPNHYVYQKNKRAWKKRKKGYAVGRMTHVSPSSGELYYLRVLLTKVRGPTCFEDIKTVNGVTYDTFRDACFACGLLDDDSEYISAIKEASVWATGSQLRKLFANMLLCCSLQRPHYVWTQTAKLISEDMFYIPRSDPIYACINISDIEKEQAALKEIETFLRQNGKNLEDFPLMPVLLEVEPIDVTNHLIMQELSYDKQALQVEAS